MGLVVIHEIKIKLKDGNKGIFQTTNVSLLIQELCVCVCVESIIINYSTF